MDPVTGFWHLVNLFIPAAGLGVLSAAGTKLLWRRETAGIAWWRLALAAGGAAAVVTLAGLWFFGQDGRMATYGAMVLAGAVTLWWRAFGRRR